VEGGWDDQHEEKSPADVVEGDGAGDQEDNVCEVETTHADSHALAADVSREDLGPGFYGVSFWFDGKWVVCETYT
jgi:hypothetical protein